LKDANMRIGILGSGLMGGRLGTIFAKAGHDVVSSYARSQRKLNRLARQAGRRATAGTPHEAAEGADVLLLAVHWSRVNDVLKQAGDLSGKVLITCSLPMNASDTALVIAHTSSGAEAHEAGFDEHATKPLDPAVLSRLLSRHARADVWVAASAAAVHRFAMSHSPDVRRQTAARWAG
jgi:predicted dinucleotide-binding enzyme